MSISVIIVNYNTGTMLAEVVQTVLSDDSIDEILVVDNNSHDNSMSLLSTNKKVKKYFRSKNSGFANSCNFAAHKAKGDYLIFLNPDCYVEKNSIKYLVTELKDNYNAGIIGCLVKNPDGSEQRATRRRLPSLWRTIKTVSKIENFASYCSCFAGVNLNHQNMPTQTIQVESISGAIIVMKDDVFNQIGGFDEKFTLHFEDLDLFKRTSDAGFKLLFNPLVTVVHHQGTSSLTNPDVKKLKKKGLIRYFKKHESKLSYNLIRLIIKVLP